MIAVAWGAIGLTGAALAVLSTAFIVLLFDLRREIGSVGGEVTALRTETIARFDRMDHKIDTHRAESNARFVRLDHKIDTHRAESNARFDRMDHKIDTHRAESNARFDRIDRRLDEHIHRDAS